MAQVMSLIDGKNETIFDASDFEELVDKYMGFEAKRYFHEILEELAGYEDNLGSYEELEEKVESLTEELAELKEEHKRLEEEYEMYKQEHGE